MKAKVLLIALSTLTATLVGCGEKTYTADYLATDKAKRIEILEACKSNKQSSENCANANTAQAAINMKISQKKQQVQAYELKSRQLAYKIAKYPNSLYKQRDEQQLKTLNDQVAQLQTELTALEQQ